MSSANRRLHMGLPLMEMDVWWPWSVSCMIFSRNKLNRMGESKHPWRTLFVVLKNWRSWLFHGTLLQNFHVVPEWLGLVLHPCWSFWGPAACLHNRLCQTPSNASAKRHHESFAGDTQLHKSTRITELDQLIWRIQDCLNRPQNMDDSQQTTVQWWQNGT